jgi:predicted alpha/beta superfamily hydrolase
MMSSTTAQCLIVLFVMVASASGADNVDVTFRVRVPADTPVGARVYVAGNLESVGRWKADGLELEPDGARHYTGTRSLPRGEVLEYKLTLGSWTRVEKAKKGAEIPNRRLEIKDASIVDIEVDAWASSTAAAPKHSLTGTIKFHERFASRILENNRTLAVYLPPGYDAHPSERYPVLYLQDGQNVFDAATSAFGVEWGADETAERLIVAGQIRPAIIVAIANTDRRADEYTADRDSKYALGGRGEAYTRFVVEEVKPFIDSHYRTRPGREDTAVAGSSLGGLISLQIAGTHPEQFSMCGLISPAFGWANEKALTDFERGDLAWAKKIRFWIDMGTREGARSGGPGTELPRTQRFVRRLEAGGLMPGRDFRYLEVEGGEHNEAAWAARFGDVLRFFFAPR